MPVDELLGLPAGGLVDVDGDSDYGSAFVSFLETHGSAVTRRSTLVVLADPRAPVLLAAGPVRPAALRRACDRVQVVRNVRGLVLAAELPLVTGTRR